MSDSTRGELQFDARELWERTFDAVPDLIMVVDLQHRIVRANRSMAERFATTSAALVGRLCYEVFHDKVEPPAFCPHADLLRDGQEHVAEGFEAHLGAHFVVSVSPLRDRAGTVIGSVHVARDITVRKRSEEALRRMVEESQRIAEELHDAVGQNLAGAALRLSLLRERLDGAAAREELDEILGFIDGAIQYSRTLTVELSPPLSAERGLEAAARAIAAQTQECYGLPVSLTASGALPTYSHELRDLFHRLLRELLFNVVKHAGASSASVRIALEGEALLLDVRDNGIGFPASLASPGAECSRGFGLCNFKERLRRRNGSLTVTALPGGGTRALARIPIAAGENTA